MTTETLTRPDISHSPGGTTIQGEKGMRYFQAVTLKGALSMYAKCGMIPTRGFTITKMLALAKTFTGVTYKRGQAQKACDDMVEWIVKEKATLNIQ